VTVTRVEEILEDELLLQIEADLLCPICSSPPPLVPISTLPIVLGDPSPIDAFPPARPYRPRSLNFIASSSPLAWRSMPCSALSCHRLPGRRAMQPCTGSRAHFGLPFAQHIPPRATKIATTSCGKNWFYYGLPPPCYRTGMQSKSTCFVCLALFLIAPDL
jgi:hypothetical protein